MTNTSIYKSTIGIAVAGLVLLVLVLSPTPARAADLGDGGSSYDYFVPDYGYSYDYIVPDDYGSSYDYFVPDSDYGSSYDYFVPDSGDYSYDYPSYSGRSYSSSPSYSTRSSSNVYAPTNTETCNATNSCNDNSSYSYSYTDNSDNSYHSNITIKNTESRSNYRPPVVTYNPAPYVSLSAAPYTGLELGPVGTALYWGFLVLWCLIAAYLIVVKRVQNKIFHSLNSFLFGTSDVAPARTAHTSASYSTPVARKEDTGDDFIFSQIARVRTN